jgi:hypothetical protein
MTNLTTNTNPHCAILVLIVDTIWKCLMIKNTDKNTLQVVVFDPCKKYIKDVNFCVRCHGTFTADKVVYDLNRHEVVCKTCFNKESDEYYSKKLRDTLL